MRKFKILTFAIVTGLLGFSSCSDDDGYFKKNNEQLKMQASIVGNNQAIGGGSNLAKAGGTSWDAMDAIGIYMLTAGQPLSGSSALAENKKFTTPGNGTFSAATSSDVITIPESGTVDFIAYYPYQTTITNFSYPVNVSSQTSLSAIDLLYAYNSQGTTSSITSVDLLFRHMMAKLTFTITDEGGNTVSNVKLSGMHTRADFSLVDSVFTGHSNIADITTYLTASGGSAISEAIIIPTTGTSGAKVVFTTPANTYTHNFTDGTTFQSGKNYTYNVTLSSDGSLTFSSPTIIDWIEVPSDGGGIVLNPDDNGGTNPGDGDAYEAGTFAEWDFTSLGSSNISDNSIIPPLVQNGGSSLISSAAVSVVGWSAGQGVNYTVNNKSIYLNGWDTNTTNRYWLVSLPLDKTIEQGMKVNVAFNSWATATGPKSWTCEISTDNTTWSEIGTYELVVPSNNNTALDEPETQFQFTYTVTNEIESDGLYIRMRPTSSTAINGSGVGSGGNTRLAEVSVTLAE